MTDRLDEYFAGRILLGFAIGLGVVLWLAITHWWRNRS